MYKTCESPVEVHLMQDSTNSFINNGMWDLVEEAKQWQPSVHLPLTKDMLLQQTFSYDAGWDASSYPEDDSGSYAEELAMDVDNGLSSVTGTVPAAEDEVHESDSDSYN